ncbi:hypothetical protein IFM89_035576 [Coptis chinensis]|uniref:Auxin response factor n=1 Tax=Coptis chinensis TaxID=261450 RepID=A0A835I1N2_9MAGN|nr:hypothetical protein IFM89_035576 [Coptis chinensis]
MLVVCLYSDKNSSYAELWHACAGPFVNVPRVGEKVFYFPQGHLEQVEAYTNQESNGQIPKHDLPSKILCSVMHAQLMAELDTDEVFAQVTLLPETEEHKPCTEKGTCQSQPQKTRAYTFCKTLTASDTSIHGGFSVLKRHADECLPPVDMSLQPPAQELVAKDLHGIEWRFRHVYRGQPKRHLLTTGWSTFVCSKKLVAGDVFIFVRGENGEHRVGVRRAIKPQKNATASVISNHSMQLGVLASASHAISTGSMFSVYYRPRCENTFLKYINFLLLCLVPCVRIWTSPSEFIVPYAQYMKSIEINYSVGMRLAGTVVGCKDFEPFRWPGSTWRSLRVQWDGTTGSVVCPDKVSPWNIEPLSITNASRSLHKPQPKRARIHSSASLDSSVLVNGDFFQGAVELTPQLQTQSGVLQGQETIAIGANKLGAVEKPPFTHWVPALNLGWPQAQHELENKLHCQMHDLFSPYTDNLTPIPTLKPDFAALGSYGLPLVSTFDSISENEFLEKRSIPNVNPNTAPQLEDVGDRLVTQPKGSSTCIIFGVDLVKSRLKSAPCIIASTKNQRRCPVTPLTSQLGLAESDKLLELKKTINHSGYSGSGSQYKDKCKNNLFAARSCTKVHRYGTALGRSVNLMRFNGYDELLNELDLMFDFGGKLMGCSTGWNVVYTNEEGSNMLIGDSPWQLSLRTFKKV